MAKDTIVTLGGIGIVGYLLIQEFGGEDRDAEQTVEEIEEYKELINTELEGDLSKEEETDIRNRARSRYAGCYESLNQQNKESTPSPERKQQQADSRYDEDDIAGRAMFWKNSTVACLMDRLTEVEDDDLFDILNEKLIPIAGLAFGYKAVKAGAPGAINRLKTRYDEAKETANEGTAETKTGLEVYNDPQAFALLDEGESRIVVDGMVEDMPAIEGEIYEPIPEGAGEIVISGSPNTNVLPDWLADGVGQMLGGTGDLFIEISESGVELLAQSTTASYEFLVDNPDIALLLAMAVVVIVGIQIGAISLSVPSGGISILVGFVASAAISIAIQKIVGVGINQDTAKSLGADFLATLVVR